MTIINRDMNITQQKEWTDWSTGVSSLVQTGETFLIAGPMPYPGRLQSGLIYAVGVSNAMQLALTCQRFVPGAGYTSIAVGLSNVVLQNVSVSGPIGLSGLPTPGSTILNFLAGDVFMLTTSVANGAASGLSINLVVVKTQDIVSHNSLNV